LERDTPWEGRQHFYLSATAANFPSWGQREAGDSRRGWERDPG